MTQMKHTSTLLFVSKALFKHLMLRRNFTALTSCAFFSECAKKSSFVLYLEVVVAEKMTLSKENRRFFAEAVVEKNVDSCEKIFDVIGKKDVGLKENRD